MADRCNGEMRRVVYRKYAQLCATYLRRESTYGSTYASAPTTESNSENEERVVGFCPLNLGVGRSIFSSMTVAPSVKMMPVSEFGVRGLTRYSRRHRIGEALRVHPCPGLSRTAGLHAGI
jgi:hypothetical protein